MKRRLDAAVLACVFVCLCAPAARAQTVITSEKLREDFRLMKRAYTELHPALYRYSGRAEVGRNFARLERELSRDLTLAEAYLAFSRFLARVRCGHTYANFWNQPDAVKRELFGGADKLPFTFRLVGRRMLVTASADADARLRPGVEILSIDSVPVPALLRELLALVKGDGSNDANRLHALQLTGVGEYEPFDVYHPLLRPPRGGRFRVVARDPATRRVFTADVQALTRAGRAAALENRYGKRAQSYDDLWQFRLLDGRTGYMRLGTFVTWQMKLDWKAFLKDSFDELRRKNVGSLVLDLRGNEGGAVEVLDALKNYLRRRPASEEPSRRLVRYVTVPADLNPHLKTWDDSFRDRTGRVVEAGGGFYAFRDAAAPGAETAASTDAYRGRVFVLVDASNSSATYNLASFLKRNRLATLVGQTTGGNRRGTTGGQIFFLTLPNSRIEMDLPLVGTFPLGPQPDEGLRPDVYVAPRAEDVLGGRDAELETVRRLIARERSVHEVTRR